MTKKEYADSKGLTVDQLRVEQMSYLQCEGYGDTGDEYETLDAWIDRRKRPYRRDPYEPVDAFDVPGAE